MIIIVNLVAEVERRKSITERLDKIGLTDITFIKGVDGRLLSDHDFYEFQDISSVRSRSGRDMSRSELGCALSHRLAAQMLLESESKWALILEDDVCINPDFVKKIELVGAVVSRKNNHATLITLGPIRKFRNRGRRSLCQGYDAVEIIKSWGAVGYCLNRAAAKIIVDTQSPIRLMADDWTEYSQKYGISIYGVDPFVVVEATHLQESILEVDRSIARSKKIGGKFRWFIFFRKLIESVQIYLYIKPIYGVGVHKVSGLEAKEWLK